MQLLSQVRIWRRNSGGRYFEIPTDGENASFFRHMPAGRLNEIEKAARMLATLNGEARIFEDYIPELGDELFVRVKYVTKELRLAPRPVLAGYMTLGFVESGWRDFPPMDVWKQELLCSGGFKW